MSKAKNSVSIKNSAPKELKQLIDETVKLWRKCHLTYDQAGYVSKEVRRRLGLKRVKARKNVIHRLSRDEEQKLIGCAYRENSSHGLLGKFPQMGEKSHRIFDKLLYLLRLSGFLTSHFLRVSN